MCHPLPELCDIQTHSQTSPISSETGDRALARYTPRPCSSSTPPSFCIAVSNILGCTVLSLCCFLKTPPARRGRPLQPSVCKGLSQNAWKSSVPHLETKLNSRMSLSPDLSSTLRNSPSPSLREDDFFPACAHHSRQSHHPSRFSLSQ